MNLARSTSEWLLEEANTTCSQHDHNALAILHGACCASAQPSAAERRLTLTDLSGW